MYRLLLGFSLSLLSNSSSCVASVASVTSLKSKQKSCRWMIFWLLQSKLDRPEVVVKEKLYIDTGFSDL